MVVIRFLGRRLVRLSWILMWPVSWVRGDNRRRGRRGRSSGMRRLWLCSGQWRLKRRNLSPLLLRLRSTIWALAWCSQTCSEALNTPPTSPTNSRKWTRSGSTTSPTRPKWRINSRRLRSRSAKCSSGWGGERPRWGWGSCHRAALKKVVGVSLMEDTQTCSRTQQSPPTSSSHTVLAPWSAPPNPPNASTIFTWQKEWAVWSSLQKIN